MRKLFSLKVVGGIFFFLILAAAIAGGYYYYSSYQKLLKNPDIITKQEVDWLQEKVGKLMQLPSDEVPSTATVLDKDKLKDQAFFANAENGDKILIYTKAKKAILYRPSNDKVIEVMPIALDNSNNGSATTQNIKVALYNGTNTDGLTSGAEAKIKDKIANVEITAREKAKKSDYTSTTVIDLSGSKADQAKAIAEAVGGQVSTLPDGETKPDADILVIVAQ